MSDDDFLARWSRRKQEAKTGHAEPAPERAAEASFDRAADHAPAERVPPESDLSNLPAIESIDAATDITAFLRNGIPHEMTRAALRRAWSADPAIRDFVGLAENAWDFNDPNAMPGFGPLDCSAEQLQALVGRIIGSTRSLAESLADASDGPINKGQSDDSGRTTAPQPPTVSAHGALEKTSTSEPQQLPVAVQPETPRDVAGNEVTMRRTHGSALPR